MILYHPIIKNPIWPPVAILKKIYFNISALQVLIKYKYVIKEKKVCISTAIERSVNMLPMIT